MSNSLWGICLKPNEVYSFKGKGILQLQQCSLNSQPKAGKTQLEVHALGNTYTLCTLVPIQKEHQLLTHVFIAEDQATLKVRGVNEIHVMGILEEDEDSEEDEVLLNQLKQQSLNSDDDDDEDDEEEAETATGYPTYPSYLSDLLGPDLPDDDEDDEDDDEEGLYMDQDNDEYGTLSFRDVNDNSFLGGFELRHFKLAPDFPGFEKVDLRAQEESIDEGLLNDSIATGLINALLNSGDERQIQHGIILKKKLENYCNKRRKTEDKSGDHGSDKKKPLKIIDKKIKKNKKNKKKKNSMEKTLKMMQK